MRNLLSALFLMSLAIFSQVSMASEEEPVKHLEVPSVTTIEEAENIFIEKTFELINKKTLDSTELHEIHIITYTLEQSIAYFNEHLTGKSRELTKTIAEVVENIHLDSENNRKEKTKQHLAQYAGLAKDFLTKYWRVSKAAQ